MYIGLLKFTFQYGRLKTISSDGRINLMFLFTFQYGRLKTSWARVGDLMSMIYIPIW